MKFLTTSTLLVALVFTGSVYATTITLYDGSLNGGNQTPDQQGYLDVLSAPLNYQSASGGVTNINTTSMNAAACMYTMDSITLNRNQGYSLSINMKINSETHANSTQAGFAISLSSSDSYGIFIGFWANEIWIRNEDLSKGESTSYNTTAGFVDYDIYIDGSGYDIHANDTSILSGFLRDMTGLTWLGYSNMITIGDSSNYARTNADISDITLTIPEPASCVLLVAGLAGLIRRKIKK